VLTGPVHGAAGILGDGVMHAGRDAAERNAMARLQTAVRLAERGRATNLLEPRIGCVQMYAEGHPEPVAVPLVGTRWEVRS
jgi:hypothetical protein